MPLTEDHNVMSAYRAGALRDVAFEELDGHWHSLTRTVGTSAHVTPDLRFVMPDAGDVVLLCSDGLTDMLADDHIAAVLAAEAEPEAACRRLVAEANEAGGRDNITAVVARFDGA